MARALEARILKLEAKRRPAEGLFFLAWGRTETEAWATVAAMRASGRLGEEDITIALKWPAPDDLPPSRWVEVGSLRRDEDRAISAEIERLFPAIAAREGPCEEPPGLERLMSDEELIAAIWARVEEGRRRPPDESNR